MSVDLSGHIDEVSKDISVEEFRRKYFNPQKPVVIRGMAYRQPAGEKWTMDYFKEEMGDIQVDLYDDRNLRHKEQTTTVPDTSMPFRDYLDIISKDEPTPFRMFLFNLYKHRPELREEFKTPEYINKGPMKKLGFMFFGGKDSAVRLHFDIDRSCVMLAQFLGQKRVVLFAPEYTDLLYTLPFNTHSNVDVDNPDYETHPGLKYVKGIEVVLDHGDAVFMPSGWFHYNTYLNGGMGVSYRQMSPRFNDRMIGLKNLTTMMYFDKLMQLVARKWWYAQKVKMGEKRVLRAINHHEMLQHPVPKEKKKMVHSVTHRPMNPLFPNVGRMRTRMRLFLER